MAGSRPNPVLVLIKLIGAVVVAGVLASGFVLPYIGGVGLAAKHEADNFLSTQCDLVESPPPEKTHIYASDGKTLIATIFKQDRQPVPLTQVTNSLVKALISTEDRRFYSHHGVDLRGLIRSAVSTSGGDTQGGSTLTMQYVKQVRYYQAGDNLAKQQAAIAQTIERKIQDAKCALYLEETKKESKNTILDNYLNIAFFGENSYGVETAAITYFDEKASQLSVPEAAMLVGILRAPDAYDPFQHPEAAKARRNEVLQNMVETGALGQALADKYKQAPVSLATTAPPPLREGCANSVSTIANAGFFCDYVVNWLLDNNVVTEAQLQTGGLNITTTLNARLQNQMQAGLKKALPGNATMTAIMPVVQPASGDILAMATSRQYGSKKGQTTLPIFTSYTAQAASTYKLFPLLTALTAGVTSNFPIQTPTATTYQWKFCPMSNGNVGNGDADETFRPGANETLGAATAKSSNTYFTGIADQLFGCQLQPIIDTANALGIKSFDQPSGDQGLTVGQEILRYSSAKQLVLGDVATSPLELTSAYAAVANDGLWQQPVPVTDVVMPAKSVSQQGQRFNLPAHAQRQAVTPYVAREAVSILQGDTQTIGDTAGTSAAQFKSWDAAHSSSIIAGKTGTAAGIDAKTKKDNKNGALWFVGMTPNLVSTTALINLDSPSAPASDLPGKKDPADYAYGSYSAGIWIHALGSYVASTQKSWTWATPDELQGSDITSPIGDSLADAKTLLASQSLKMQVLGGTTNPVNCASSATPGTVAYFSPDIAMPGQTVTVCVSAGFPQTTYQKPTPPPTYAPSSTTHTGPSNPFGDITGGASGNSGTSSSTGNTAPSLPNLNTRSRTRHPGGGFSGVTLP